MVQCQRPSPNVSNSVALPMETKAFGPAFDDDQGSPSYFLMECLL